MQPNIRSYNLQVTSRFFHAGPGLPSKYFIDMTDPSDRSRDPKDDAEKRAVRPPADLIDFYRRWSEFRAGAVALTKREDLPALGRQTVEWLIRLADRIGERDITPPGGHK